MIFHGIQTSIDKEPYVFVSFQGGGGPDPMVIQTMKTNIYYLLVCVFLCF